MSQPTPCGASPAITGTQDLYRFYDADGALLYVGISMNAAARASQHKAEKAWWGEVRNIEVETLTMTRRLAEAVEADAIRAEMPRYNIKHAVKPHVAQLAWECRYCQEPIKDGTGYVFARNAERRAYNQEAAGREAAGPRIVTFDMAFWKQAGKAKWLAAHGACDPAPGASDYWYAVERLRTFEECVEFAAHVSEKSWARNQTNISEFLYDVLSKVRA